MPVEALAAASRPAGSPLGRILVRDGAQVHVLPVETIDYIEAQDDYIAVHAAGRSHLKQQTIAALEARLDASRFVRIHRSYILNLDRLARIELMAKDTRVVILRDGTRLPLSRSGHARLRTML
jgi:two-component system LytT family response regulator